MFNFLRRFVRDETGLESVEFAVITALIVGVIVIVLASLGDALSGRFSETEEILTP